MKGFDVMKHATLQIVRNPGTVLRIFAPPLALSFLLVWLMGLQFILSQVHFNNALMRGLVPWGKVSLVTVGGILVFVWSAVAWHRFILLVERPQGVRPTVQAAVFGLFLGKALLIGILSALITILFGVIVGVVYGFSAGITKAGPGWFTHVVAFALGFPVLALVLRIAPVLPGVAAGEGTSVRDAWNATAGQFWVLLTVLGGLITFSLGLDWLAFKMAMTPFSAVGFIWVSVSLSLKSVLALSVATTIYGHYVEKRPLV
ncbi:hypothetical protein [Tabrizicola sp.]|uniref:hypothetical protein n=1 Tax=Tabrizicola sp. TaxID=2005166 RepID=UPI00286C23C6|nr:hypothetical protein [Tabrizicola sp.]